MSALVEMSPLTCSARLELGSSSDDSGEHQSRLVSLPNWLRGFLLAERYSSALSVVVESDLATSFGDPIVQSADFHTQMIPSSQEEGAWTCVIRYDSSDYSRLAVLPQGSRLIVEVKGDCEPSPNTETREVITRSELTLAPAFRVLVPSLYLSDVGGFMDFLNR